MKLAVAVALLVGCGGGGKSAEVSSPELFADAYHDAYCQYAARCGLWSSAAACDPAQIFIPDFAGYDIQQAVASGRAIWSEANANACIAAVLNKSCDVTDETQRLYPVACLTMTSGTLGDGEIGGNVSECISDQPTSVDCDSRGCCKVACAGNLAPRVAQLDETCGGRLGCIAGTWCPQSGGFPDLLDQVCTPLVGEGESCAMAGSAMCAYGLACMNDGTCHAPKKLGAACTGVDVCRDIDAACDGQTCVKLPTVGSTCEEFGCGANLTCDLTQHVCVSGVPRGQACTFSGDFCEEPGDACLTTPSMFACEPAKPNGASCFAFQDCQSGYCNTQALCADRATCP